MLTALPDNFVGAIIVPKPAWAAQLEDRKSYYPMLRNSASGPDIGLPGRILIGKASKSALWPAEGRPEGRC